MRTRTLTPFCLLPLLCTTLAFGCSDDAPAADDGNETTAASGTADDTESSGAMDTTTTEDPSTTDTNDDSNFVSEEGPETGMEAGGNGNLGDQCQSGADCADDLFCNGVPGFGGICSECASDADCEMGNCTFLGSYFGCGDGGQGQQCESDDVCADDLYCAEVVNLGGLFNGNFCSECKVDDDCPDGQLCAPQIEFTDLADISGQRACIEPGTAPNDQLCDANGSGDEQCEGWCTTADIMGLIQVGVCGDCETDEHCDEGTCMPAVIGFDGFSGSVCG